MGKFEQVVASEADIGAENEQWFRAQVQAALDSAEADVPHDEMMAELRAIIESRRAAQDRLGG